VKYFFKNNTRNDEIESVELISYSPENVAVVESADEMLDFQSENMEILEILDAAKNADFIFEFSSIEFFQGYPHLNTPNGMGIKINYHNGDFLIVTDSFIDEEVNGGDAILYNSDGIFIDYYGSISWLQNLIDLINGFFEKQIE
ncbi:MAG: hypothetical protein WCX25_02800, partial [Candidatus Izemoplasmatales bacterium]